jgi:23S rRNA (adenine2503-C2)-methyltransferase
MGMGEPLANLRNLLAALATLDARYPSISRVSVSTAGPARRIDALTASMPVAPPVHLLISLHATTDQLRRRLVPNAPESVDRLLDARARYHRATGDHVCLNYILLKGLNDFEEDTRRLAAIDPEVFYVKLTALNAIPGLPEGLASPPLTEIREFGEMLRARGMPHKIFVGDGLDVQASCGQAARPVPVLPPEMREQAPV